MTQHWYTDEQLDELYKNKSNKFLFPSSPRENQYSKYFYKRQADEYSNAMKIQEDEINRKRYEEDFQKRRIAEKQIRALRRNYRAQSFIQPNNPTDMADKLGG